MTDNTDDEAGVGALISRLVEDAKAFVRAEIAVYRAQALKIVDDYRTAAILCVVALMMANAAIVALLVGIIMSIARALGPIWATAITVGGTFVLCGVLLWVASSIVRSADARGKAR